MNSGRSPSLLIIGGPDVGKTVYGSQVLARLRRARAEVALRGPPANIAPFELALNRLSQGLAPEHTGAATYHELILPLEMRDGSPVDLVWPDYGGEQIRDIVELRRIPSPWQARAKSASGWLLFIRLDRIRRPEDVTTRPPEHINQHANVSPQSNASSGTTTSSESVSWSDAAKLVELLQVLLFVRHTGVMERATRPPLSILLSCWDELPGASERPAEELRRRLPLLAHFVESMWHAKDVEVFGLSAQGRALSRDRVDEEYVDQGPEQFGYVVLGDGRRVDDLTAPVASLLRHKTPRVHSNAGAWKPQNSSSPADGSNTPPE
jgi:hypothetical protein